MKPHLLWMELGLRMQSWRVQSHVEPPGAMGRFARQVALTLALQVIVGLWLTGAFRPLSATW